MKFIAVYSDNDNDAVADGKIYEWETRVMNAARAFDDIQYNEFYVQVATASQLDILRVARFKDEIAELEFHVGDLVFPVDTYGRIENWPEKIFTNCEDLLSQLMIHEKWIHDVDTTSD